MCYNQQHRHKKTRRRCGYQTQIREIRHLMNRKSFAIAIGAAIGTAIVIAMVTAACRGAAPPPIPTAAPAVVVETPTARPVATRRARPQAASTPTAVPTATTRAVTAAPPPTATMEPTFTPTATASPRPLVVQIEPTLTPRPGDEEMSVAYLPLGQPGNYVNVTFGYWLQYPTDWHTRFGNRPLLASFSNLDPGTHNRESMRAEGCLIEVTVSPNVYGFTFESLAAQMPRSFPGAQEFLLDGERAWRVRRSSDSDYESEWVSVQHAERLFTLTVDYAHEASAECLSAWDDMLDTWRWFAPSFAHYRNTIYGYTVSHPREWYRFNAHDAGVSFSSEDPAAVTDWIGFLQHAMVVEINVFDNDRKYALKEWLAAYDLDVQLANDIPLDGLLGVRVITDGPGPGIEALNGYFQGPLGRVYEISCLYPLDARWEYRPIANAIIYSFGF